MLWNLTHVQNHNLTLSPPGVMNMELLPIISLLYPENNQLEYSNVSDRSCYLDPTPNSQN